MNIDDLTVDELTVDQLTCYRLSLILRLNTFSHNEQFTENKAPVIFLQIKDISTAIANFISYSNFLSNRPLSLFE